ncbi:CHAT domain-containing protein [Frankia sp. Cj3]|uniref:CHAT domain-containing protein n=1 Tax=Frankia sp. Cj3 TaxID=2880976 RepID=UPI001EF3EE72|nr:CHAT domain-containing protein [Frankia sp. Cj3]
MSDSAAGWSDRAEELFSAIEETEDLARADEAIQLFSEALRTAPPSSPDAPLWQYRLGMLHAWMAGPDPADWDLAVTWLCRTLAAPAHLAVDRDDVISDLVWAMLQRCFTVAEPGSGALDRLADALDGIPRPSAGSRAAIAVHFYRGVSWLSRLQTRDDQDDRKRVSALLDDVLADVPDDWPLLPETLLEYASICADDGRFDRGLAVVARARALPEPLVDDVGEAALAAEFAAELDFVEAKLLDGRILETDGTPDAANALIAVLARVVARPGASSYLLERYGFLLAARGDRTSSPADLELGARWLRAALDAVTDPAEQVTPTWYLLALAYRRRAEILNDAALFDAASECLQTVLARPDDAVDPDEVTVDLAVMLFARYFAVPGARAVDRLVDTLDQVPRRPAGSLGAVALDYYGAAARLVRAQLVPARAGVDQAEATAILDRVLPQVPDGWHLLAGVLLDYAHVCGRAGRFGDGLTALARARRVAKPPGHPEQVDPDAVDRLEAMLRAGHSNDPAVLETLLGQLTADETVATDAEPGNAEFLAGLLLIMHAARAGSEPAILAALTKLDAALRSGVEPAAVAWCVVGVIRVELAARNSDASLREEAGEYFRTALRSGLAEVQPTLAALAHRRLAEALAVRLQTGGYPDAVIGEAAAEVAAAWPLLADGRLGADARAELAGALVPLVLPMMVRDLDFDVARLDELRAALEAHPSPPATWPTLLGTFVMVRDMLDGLVRAGPAGVSTYSESRAREAFRGSPIPDALVPFVAYQEVLRAHATGERARMQGALELIEGHSSPEARMVAGLAKAQLAGWEGTDAVAALDQIAQSIEDYGADDPAAWLLHSDMLPSVRLLRMMSRAMAGERVSPREYARLLPALLRGATDLRRGHNRRAGPGPATDPLTSALSGLLPLMQAILAAAVPFYPAGARREIMKRAERFAGTGEPGAIAIGHWFAAQSSNDAHALAEAIVWADRALAALGGPQHLDWAGMALIAAEARRRRRADGDLRRSRELGLSVLQCHTWRVLLQSGTDDALAAARDAIEDALSVADWCAEDREADDLIRALDAGRGLALYAAVTTRSAMERLTDLEEGDLAAEWAEAGGNKLVDIGLRAPVQNDLRRRVVEALAAAQTGDLLDPPHPDRIRAALRQHGSDALVYLIPGGPTEGGGTRLGRAVVVPARATAPLQILTFSEMVVGPGTPLERYAEKYQACHRNNQPKGAKRAAVAPWRAELSSLVDWAGRVAGTSLLQEARAWSADPDCPRLVLVPVGALALVPWHAAVCEDSRGARQPMAARAVVSYIPSARLLRRAVDAPPVTAGEALIVGNPAGARSLRGAALEARAVRKAFYGTAALYGRRENGQAPPDRAGTPAEVLAWLRDRRSGRRLLHLACHGYAEPADPTRSRLELASGSLATTELLAHQPGGAPPVERVFLCACSTNVTGTDYDEAFSLATAFLAAGARTVFGSMWDVPDELTSRIVFAVHHYLAEGCSPAEALHWAQLWSLTPDRPPLPSMPDELLAAETGASDDPAGWAGLIHLGV